MQTGSDIYSFTWHRPLDSGGFVFSLVCCLQGWARFISHREQEYVWQEMDEPEGGGGLLKQDPSHVLFINLCGNKCWPTPSRGHIHLMLQWRKLDTERAQVTDRARDGPYVCTGNGWREQSNTRGASALLKVKLKTKHFLWNSSLICPSSVWSAWPVTFAPLSLDPRVVAPSHFAPAVYSETHVSF